MSPEQNAEGNYSQQYQVITSIPRILSVLRPILEKHTLITISFKESKRLYNTALLNIDADNGTITIDELHPADGNNTLRKTQQLIAHTLLDGVDVNFTTLLQGTGNKDGVEYYLLKLPETLRYRQRREAYRVAVGPVDEIPVTLTTADKNSFDGLLFDISTGGICVRYPAKKDPTDELGTGEINCSISFPDKSHLNCFLKVCHSYHHQASNQIHIGCRFSQLDKSQHRSIERFVAGLQRKTRKKDSR